MFRLFALGLCALASAAFAHAPDGGVELGTEVRARRLPRSAAETSVERDVIQAAPKQSAVDLLRLVPGLVATQHSGAGKAQQLFLRGFDAVHGQDVELNVGGIPVNEVSHIHGLGYADVNWLIPEVVKELRVYEGPYRAFQGDFAIAGTVQFDLGLAKPGFLASGTLDQFLGRRALVAFRPEASEQSFVAAELADSPGFGARRANRRLNLLGQGVYTWDDFTFRALAGSYTTDFESPGVVRDDDFRSGRVGFFDATTGHQGGRVQRHQLLLSGSHVHEGARTTLSAFGVLAQTELFNNFTGYLQREPGDGLKQIQNTRYFGAKLEHRQGFEVVELPFVLEAQLGFRHDDGLQHQSKYRESDGARYTERPAGDVRDDVLAHFGQTDAWLGAELSTRVAGFRVMLGFRGDWLIYDVDDKLVQNGAGYRRAAGGIHPGLKAAISRALGEHFELFANYGDGFRSPQARSLAGGEAAPFASVRAGELGGVFSAGTLAVQGSAFTSWVERDFFFDHTVGTTSLTGATVRAGATLSALWRPVPGLVVSGSGTAVTAQQLSTGTLLPYFAPFVGRLDAGYRPVFHLRSQHVRAHLGGALTAVGPRSQPFGDTSYGYALVDLRGGLGLGPFELRVDVTNLFDSRWRDGEFTYASDFRTRPVASQLPSAHFTAGAPRTFSVTVEVQL